MLDPKKYQKLKEEIQAAVPEIRNIQTGCIFQEMGTDLLFEFKDEFQSGNIILRGICTPGHLNPNMFFDKLKIESDVTLLLNYILIGRPIVWDDVAIALFRKGKLPGLNNLTMGVFDGQFKGSTFKVDESGILKTVSWIWGKTLDDQSDDMKNALIISMGI